MIGELRALSAVEAVRLLQERHPAAATLGGLDAERESLRLRPALGLAFAAGEVVDARERPEDGRTEVVLTLPALYGPGSPLPTYVTERLLGGEREGSRAVIDILNHRLLSLTLRVAGGARTAPASDRERMAAWSGLGERVQLLRWAGLLRPPRSAADLEALLVDCCAPYPVRLLQHVRSDHILGGDERSRLGRTGSCLGRDAVIGDTVATRTITFAIEIGPLGAVESERFAADTDLQAAIVDAVALFNPELLDWRLVLLIDGASLGAAALTGGAELARSARLAGRAPATYRIGIVSENPLASAAQRRGCRGHG